MKRRIAALALALTVSGPFGCSDLGDDLASANAPLPAPSDLAGFARNGGTEILLTWTDNSTVETAFRVDVSSQPIAADSDVEFWEKVPANTTSYVYPSVPNSITYFRVLAQTDTTQSKPSPVISVVTPDVPPAASLSGALASATAIDLTWIDLPNETSYRLERSFDQGATWAALAALSADVTSHQDTGLAPDTEYRYRLIGMNANGEGAPSNEVALLTPTAAMSIVTVYAPGDVGRYSSVAVDPAGTEHISHYDGTNGDALYSTNEGQADPDAVPYPTAVADAGHVAGADAGYDGTSIALDAAGKVHIAGASRDFGTGTFPVRYVTDSGGSLAAASVIDAATLAPVTGSAPRLRISALDGTIHIVYRDGPSLRRAEKTGPSAWAIEDVATEASASIGDFSFVIAPNGTFHVSYERVRTSPSGRDLVHGQRSGAGSWSFTDLATLGSPGSNSIAADPSSAPHVVYFDRTNTRLVHATNAGGSWTHTVIDEEPGVSLGLYNAVAVDHTAKVGRVHVAYYDLTNGDLRYARRDPGGAWVRRSIDVANDVGRFPALAVDDSGAVHISYYDVTAGDLKRARGAP